MISESPYKAEALRLTREQMSRELRAKKKAMELDSKAWDELLQMEYDIGHKE